MNLCLSAGPRDRASVTTASSSAAVTPWSKVCCRRCLLMSASFWRWLCENSIVCRKGAGAPVGVAHG